eukprot:3654538-Rhodomonas_salina.1
MSLLHGKGVNENLSLHVSSVRPKPDSEPTVMLRSPRPIVPRLKLSLSSESLKVKTAREREGGGGSTSRSGALTERIAGGEGGWEGGTRFLQAITDRAHARRYAAASR